ncbi:protein kinase [Aureococcus anophagefferens]|nr:protein kinase [Aureococcus anophagefferens]
MVKLRSPRVVQVLGVVTTDPTWLGFVVEYMAGARCARLDETRRSTAKAPSSPPTRRRSGGGSATSRWACSTSTRGVEHRDLKTLNVLLDEARRRCKVTDFGLSKSNDLNTAATTMATQQGGGAKGTPAYMAPELLGSNTFTEKTDVYAFAILIWEIGMKVLVQKARPPVPEDAPPDLVALMERCWADDPAARPTFDACRSWLAEQDAFSPQASFGALAPQASSGPSRRPG